MTSIAKSSVSFVGSSKANSAFSCLRSLVPLSVSRANRATSVSIGNRVSSYVFGLPSFLRANGILECRAFSSRSGKKRSELSVFALDRRGTRNSERLPRIWLTERAIDRGGECYSGDRSYVEVYPSGPDAGGWHALELAERCFGEGTAVYGENSEEMRIQCMQAAEILYLHAIERGNPKAYTRLATVYRYNMCCGKYWRETRIENSRHAGHDALEARAYELYRKAAAKGDAEAMWNLGDMVLEGKGHPRSEKLAFVMNFRAVESATHLTEERAAAMALSERALGKVLAHTSQAGDIGAAAIRVARCLENGTGCVQSFELAKCWYKVAARALEKSFSEGSWHCKRELLQAKTGISRMRQEICGRY